MGRTSSSGMMASSSSPSAFHFSIMGGMSKPTRLASLRPSPTESASVPIASYRISRFFCWYLLNAKTRLRMIGSRNGCRRAPASSSSVANAEQPASCTRLLLSSTALSRPSIVGRKNWAWASAVELALTHQLE